MGKLGPLPPIDGPSDPAPTQPAARSAAEQAELENELDAAHEALGVKRGQALKEAMKPEFVVPTPPLRVAVPTAAVVTRSADASVAVQR